MTAPITLTRERADLLESLQRHRAFLRFTVRDLSDEQSERVNARLILLMANHIGDVSVLREALAIARQNP